MFNTHTYLHSLDNKQLGLNKSQGCLKNTNEKHLARILFDKNKKRLEGFRFPLFASFCLIKVQISVYRGSSNSVEICLKKFAHHSKPHYLNL